MSKKKIIGEEVLQIKVIIENGVVSAVLKDRDVPVYVEVVDCNDDYEDIEKLEEYRDSILIDKTLKDCDYNTANFEESLDGEGV